MGVAVNILSIFLACQILLFGSIDGLPFASISAIPSLTSTETSSNESSTSSQASILVNENALPSSSILTSPSKNFQLVIGLPFDNANYLLPTDGTNSDQTSSPETWSITLPTSISFQPKVVSQNPVSETTSLTNDVILDTTSPAASSVLSIPPKLNLCSISNGIKRELSDTISVSSQESCLSANSPPSFYSDPTLAQLKPTFPCVETPVHLTQLSNQNKRCVSGDSDNLSNSGDCDCTLYSPPKSSPLLTNVSPCPNMLAFNSFNNREPTFNDLKNYVNSRQGLKYCSNSGIQNQQNMDTNISPSDMIRLNNNLMKAKALQHNMLASQPIIRHDTNSENSINENNNFVTEYQNLLRIRNDGIPKMLTENVKSIAQNNNEDIQGCPQLETTSVQNNVPYVQNNKMVLSSSNNCEPSNTGIPFAFNNIARTIKDNMKENNNNNLGCPQLRSIPIYDKESLLNKQALSQDQNNNMCLGQVMNQNSQGCPQLLAIAQSSLYQKINNEGNGVNQNCNCANEWTQSQDNNCNCNQMFTPNDNLAQALQMINHAKTNQVQTNTASINILPYGETLLDGKPISHNFISLDSLSCPAQLPTCSCTDSCNLQKKLTPVNSICYSPSINTINSASPKVTNIAPTVPNVAISNTQFPQSCVQTSIFNQNSCCNNNIQSLNPIITPTFIPIQSLAKVPFVNNIPSSTISVTPLSLPDTYVSPISSLPSVCTSIQPIVSPPYPLVTSNFKQTEGLSGASAVFSPINNIVNSLTKNILSTLVSKKLPTSPSLAKLPPVNPYSSNLIAESTASVLSLFPISDIPVACNEYVPPMYNSIIPISSFNPNLFCVESDPCDSCVPFALSITDTYYPETSLMIPLPSDYSCLCGSLFAPSTLPQASSVIKMNNVVNMYSS